MVRQFTHRPEFPSSSFRAFCALRGSPPRRCSTTKATNDTKPIDRTLSGAVAPGPEGRQMIAQRVSAGFRPPMITQPRQGRQKPHRLGLPNLLSCPSWLHSPRPLANLSSALRLFLIWGCPVCRPAGAGDLWDVRPTADAVGYRLSVLRTCAPATWGLASTGLVPSTDPRQSGMRECRAGKGRGRGRIGELARGYELE